MRHTCTLHDLKKGKTKNGSNKTNVFTQCQQMERKQFNNILIRTSEVMQGAHICVAHINRYSFIHSWTHWAHALTSEPQLCLTHRQTHTHWHTQTHTTRNSEGSCSNKGIILLLTQPILLKTKKESYAGTLQPSKGNNTHALHTTRTHKHAHTGLCSYHVRTLHWLPFIVDCLTQTTVLIMANSYATLTRTRTYNSSPPLPTLSRTPEMSVVSLGLGFG